MWERAHERGHMCGVACLLRIRIRQVLARYPLMRTALAWRRVVRPEQTRGATRAAGLVPRA